MPKYGQIQHIYNIQSLVYSGPSFSIQHNIKPLTPVTSTYHAILKTCSFACILCTDSKAATKACSFGWSLLSIQSRLAVGRQKAPLPGGQQQRASDAGIRLLWLVNYAKLATNLLFFSSVDTWRVRGRVQSSSTTSAKDSLWLLPKNHIRSLFVY